MTHEKNSQKEYYFKKAENKIEKRDYVKLNNLFDSLNRDLEFIAKKNNITVDELRDLLDLSKPFPYERFKSLNNK